MIITIVMALCAVGIICALNELACDHADASDEIKQRDAKSGRFTK